MVNLAVYRLQQPFNPFTGKCARNCTVCGISNGIFEVIFRPKVEVMIRKITLILALCATTFAGQAQYNFNLNDWTNNTTAVSWGAAFNDLAPILGDTSVVRATEATGFSAKLKPVDLSPFGVPLYASLFSYGVDGGGVAFTGAFDSVYFDAVAVTGGSDLQMLVTVATTNLNGDTVKYGEVAVMGDYATFTEFGIQMDFYPGMNGMSADSMFIDVISLTSDNSTAGAYNKVDNFRLANATGSTGLANIAKEAIKVYPTLVKDMISVHLANTTADKFVAISMDGKVVAEQVLNSGITAVQVSNLENGSYIYQVVDAQNNVVTTGKFVVSK